MLVLLSQKLTCIHERGGDKIRDKIGKNNPNPAFWYTVCPRSLVYKKTDSLQEGLVILDKTFWTFFILLYNI